MLDHLWPKAPSFGLLHGLGKHLNVFSILPVTEARCKANRCPNVCTRPPNRYEIRYDADTVAISG